MDLPNKKQLERFNKFVTIYYNKLPQRASVDFQRSGKQQGTIQQDVKRRKDLQKMHFRSICGYRSALETIKPEISNGRIQKTLLNNVF